MKPLHLLILILLLNGCASGRFSTDEGVAKFTIPFDWPESQKKEIASKLNDVYLGMSKSDLCEAFKEFHQKGYHKEGNEEWITFSTRRTGEPGDTVTFYLVDTKVKEWMQK